MLSKRSRSCLFVMRFSLISLHLVPVMALTHLLKHTSRLIVMCVSAVHGLETVGQIHITCNVRLGLLRPYKAVCPKKLKVEIKRKTSFYFNPSMFDQ